MKYSNNPSFRNIITDCSKMTRLLLFEPVMWKGYKFPSSSIREWSSLVFITYKEVVAVLITAVLITFIRMVFERYVCKRFMNRMGITDKVTRSKCAESMFKTLAYIFTWTICLYLVHKDRLLEDNTQMWKGWTPGMNVPIMYKLIYLVEGSFYIHSLYGTVYMDVHRNDYPLMIIHHTVTVMLILFSYATRFHACGVIVMFLHDINDILMEGSKFLTYLKFRNGRYYPIFDTLALIGFGFFTVSWVITRTYLFLYRLIYSTIVVGPLMLHDRHGACWIPSNALLIIVYCIDLYWLYNIARMLFRLLTGEMSVLKDIRDEDNDADRSKTE